MAGSLAARAASGAAAVALLAAAPAGAATPGAPGVGDPYLPKAGNGGYDVGHYDLRLRYLPQQRRLSAHALITATAAQDLSRFNLDYRGPKVRRVLVDGERARHRRSDGELIVTPPAALATGAQFRVKVSYRGRPRPIRDADGSLSGWIPTGDGAFVAGEPHGSPSWYPSNDHPSDKATFEFRVHVPHRTKAIANGRLVDRERRGRWSRWHWVEDQPMATYLATVTTGRFKITRTTTRGIPTLNAVDPRQRRGTGRALRQSGEIIALFETLFGPYPFNELGAIVDHAGFVGYALETQTRPIYSSAPNDVLVAHELAHQWFGNSVTPQTWENIWLNEGFATWAEWRWAQEAGGKSTAERLAELEATSPEVGRFWNPPPGRVGGPAQLFADSVYVRGAMTLEALRQRVGEQTFLAIMRAWVADRAYGNATIDDFVALAESQSGESLDAFFERYLYQPGKP